jgi:hypothetical protein
VAQRTTFGLDSDGDIAPTNGWRDTREGFDPLAATEQGTIGARACPSMGKFALCSRRFHRRRRLVDLFVPSVIQVAAFAAAHGRTAA